MLDTENVWVVWGIGSIVATIMLPIVIFKVWGLPRDLGGIIMLLAVSLIAYSWATVVILLLLSIGRYYYMEKQREREKALRDDYP